jgi:hypothetical protein
MRFPSVAVFVAMASATLFAACSSGNKPCADLFCESPDTGTGVDAQPSDDANPFPDSGKPQPTFSATCAQTTIDVAMNSTNPTVSCTASQAVMWSVDRGEIGTMNGAGPSTSATLTPTGTTGGVVTVLATLDKSTVGVPILVKLSGKDGPCPQSQIATSTTQLTTGGGVGGVGGEGCGTNVTDQATLNALANPTTNSSLVWLYPYDKTVFPRGVLAPLLQWNWTTNDADAILIKLSTATGSFSWTGTFTRPAILSQTNTGFTRHPIPENVWEMATNTAGTKINNQRDDLTVSIVIAKGGQGYGPISETWTIAPGALKGTLYYGAYGTNYNSTNSCAGTMGAGTLAIKHGATSPIPITSTTKCTQCHVVSADGSTLVTDHDPCPGNGQDYDWLYDLKNLGTPADLPQVDGVFTWGALSPKGNLFFSDSAPATPPQLVAGDLEGASTSPSALFAMPGGTSVVTSAQIQSQLGLTSQLGGSLPVFSPDGKHIAFNFYKGGPGVDNKSGDGKSIAVVDFDGVSKFSNLRTVYTPPTNSSCPTCAAVWMSFAPTNDALIFELETSNTGTFASTGGRGELWWVDLATKTPHRLDMANGAGYLPSGPNSHATDATLQYEPSVLPIASGGYVWVVFTSRRLYGSVATADPWTQAASTNTSPTLKKLWVMAFDLNAPVNTDASHPAFYLPAQDLLTVNARAYWVLDPCKSTGTSCETGDECCGGHCGTPDDAGTGLVCGKPTTCGGEGDTCVSGTDCCSGLQCVGGPDNGHCDVIPVK